jgi:glycosyltransferase involved in cell wall biosynthesis
LKILFVSIHFGPPFQRDLMKALTARGHEVSFYSAGLTNLSGRLALQWKKREGRIEARLLNSPVVPASSMDPAVQDGGAAVDAVTEQVLDRVKPDLVHVHELSGHGLSLFDVLKRRAIPYVVSIHNFWTLCPQMNLIDAEGSVCRDFEGGVRCMRCRWLPDAGSRTGVERVKSSLAATPLFKPLRRMRQTARRLMVRRGSVSPAGWSAPRFTAEAFARRRAHAVEGLNGARAIHAMSSRSATILEALGVRRERIRIAPISLFSLDTLEPAKRGGVSRPLTFGYRGSLSYLKGVHLLLSAFSKLDQTKARLLIYGSGEPSYELGLRAMATGLKIEFRGEYDAARLPEINAGIDVGIVPSLCDETFCLTGFEFLRSGSPVIATEMGGMIDYVRDGVNGWLVPPRDVDALASVMQRLVDSPADIDALRVSVPSPSMNDVVDSMLDLYREAIANE